MRRLAKIFFGMLFISAFLASCDDCEDCNTTTWNEEYHIANSTDKKVCLTETDGNFHIINPLDSLIIKIDNITGFQYMGHKPFESLSSITFNDSISNNFSESNEFDLNNGRNFIKVDSNSDYKVYRYEITNDDYNFALKQSKKE